MSKTTIQLDDSTKERIDRRKAEAESYDTAVNRILDGGAGVLFTEDEIRRMARDEAEDVVQSVAHR